MSRLMKKSFLPTTDIVAEKNNSKNIPHDSLGFCWTLLCKFLKFCTSLFNMEPHLIFILTFKQSIVEVLVAQVEKKLMFDFHTNKCGHFAVVHI